MLIYFLSDYRKINYYILEEGLLWDSQMKWALILEQRMFWFI